jgi:ABC-type proline/glycine betaine transport system substrate-binding protein
MLTYEKEARKRLEQGYIDVVEAHKGYWIPKTMADNTAIKSLMRPSENIPHDYESLLNFASGYGLSLHYSESDTFEYRHRSKKALDKY